MIIIDGNKKIICDYCYPVEAILTTKEGRDLCLICAAIEGLI